jgi:DNA gyrase subunit A
VSEMRVMGRNTQGVRLINLRENDEIAAVAKVDADEEVQDIEQTPENGTPSSPEPDTAE